MNMISTGAFLTEMDASNKQPTVAEKFAAVWEKKNAKAARAGGVSLMALSLAACGGSSSTTTTTTTDTTTETETPAEPTTPVVTPVSAAMTTSQDIITNLTTANDSVTATQATVGSTDVLVDDNSTDSDTFTVASDGTASNLGSVVGIENIVVNQTSFGTAAAITVTNVASGTLTVNNLQNGGSTNVDVNDAGSITVAAGTGVTGTIDVAMVADAATVVNTGTATAAIVDAAGTIADQTITVVTAGNINLTATDAEALNVSGTGNVTLLAASTDLDGSAAAITGSAGQTLIAGDSNDVDGAVVSGFDAVKVDTNAVANTSFDATGYTSAVHATATAASTDTFILASGGTLILDADVSATVDYSDGSATTTTTTGVANVTLAEASAAGGTTIVVNGTGDRVSTLNITADANQTVGDVTITAGTATAVTLAGAGNVDLVTTGFTTAASTLNASGLSGNLTATVDAQLLTITGGSGDDSITNLTDVASVLDGGAGVDTLTTALLNNKATISNFEILALGQATNDFDASQLAGKTYAVTGGTDIEINATSAIDVATIDLSGLAIATATVDVKVDLSKIDATVLLSTQGMTYTGTTAVDTVIGSGNADTITLGNGADTVTAGLGADTIDLTETTAAIDTVIMTTGGAIAADTIIGFKAGAGGDNVDIDLSDINALVTVLNTADAAVAATAAASQIGQVAVGAYDMGSAAAGDNILNIVGDYASADALATALEVGGTSALTADGTFTAGDAFLVTYDNGTDSFLAYVSSTAGAADNATFAADDLTVTNIMTFTGIADSATFVAGNFDIIA